MASRIVSKHLGSLSDAQLQAALDRFHLGRFLGAEPVPFGTFRQNVFVSSTEGDYVLRGKPLFWWQFPTEQFYARFLHERAHAPAPWPYRIDPTTDIFGWSYVLMPRMPGLQLADPQVREQLLPSDRQAIASTLGENLVHMQQATWPYAGRYQAATGTVEPFELAHELAWPLPVESDPDLAALSPTIVSYSERVKACLRHQLARARKLNAAATTKPDIAWVEDCLAEANVALRVDARIDFEGLGSRQASARWTADVERRTTRDGLRTAVAVKMRQDRLRHQVQVMKDRLYFQAESGVAFAEPIATQQACGGDGLEAFQPACKKEAHALRRVGRVGKNQVAGGLYTPRKLNA